MSQYRIYHNNPNYEFVEPPYEYIFPNSLHSPIHTIILKIFDPKKFEEFKFSFSDYFYIRFGILPKYESKNENCKKRESFNL